MNHHFRKMNKMRAQQHKQSFNVMKEIRKEEEELQEANPDEKFMCLIPQKIENKEIDIEMNELQEKNIIMKPNTSAIICGPSGCGKSNTIIWSLMQEDFYKNTFDEIYLFSRSADIDPLFKKAGIKKKNIISKNIESKVKDIISKQEKALSKNRKTSKKILCIFEDSTSDKDLLKSEAIITLFTMGRHRDITTWLVCHKYKSVVRSARMSANYILMFPGNNSETLQLIEDWTPSGVNKKRMLSLFYDAFTPTEQDAKPFMFVNLKVDPRERFRKGYYQIYDLERQLI